MNFAGKVAIVTGGASGIGLACVKGFAEGGAKGIMMASTNAERGARESSMLRKLTGCDVKFTRTDVSDEKAVREMVECTVNAWGHIDILVNNASICPVTRWEDVTLENWDRIIAINLTGMFLCTKAVVPYMRAQKGGKIVFIASTSALVGSHIAHPAYGVSKAGEVAFMKSVAKEFSKDGILTTAVLPGPTETGISDSFTQEMRTDLANGTLLKRYAKPSEIANAVLFLSSPESSFMTGTAVQVSGGEILY